MKLKINANLSKTSSRRINTSGCDNMVLFTEHTPAAVEELMSLSAETHWETKVKHYAEYYLKLGNFLVCLGLGGDPSKKVIVFRGRDGSCIPGDPFIAFSERNKGKDSDDILDLGTDTPNDTEDCERLIRKFRSTGVV